MDNYKCTITFFFHFFYASLDNIVPDNLHSHRSEEEGLCYTTYIGDGDSSSYKRVYHEKSYCDNVKITEEECIGHKTKRMGSRLRTLKQCMKPSPEAIKEVKKRNKLIKLANKCEAGWVADWLWMST